MSVADRVRSSLEAFSPSERKVARALLANYPIAGLETIAELAQRANVSAPTVVRFIARLEFAGYAAFQKALMREVHASHGSPLKQYDKTTTMPPGDILRRMSEAYAAHISETFAELPEPEFHAAVALLADERKRIRLLGGRFSRVLADYFGTHLELLRGGVSQIPHDETSRLAIAASSSKADVLVVFDYRRYDPDTVRFAQRVAARGSSVILLTDSGMSPISDIATIVLPARVEVPSPFDSLVSSMAVVEGLTASLAERLGEAGRRRLESIERMRAHSD